MLTIGDVYNAVNTIAPFSLAESWDNTGLLVGSHKTQLRGAVAALDVTDAVIEEAVCAGANLIITHHPVIFSPLKQIDGESLLYRLIALGIAVISAHTNLDIAAGGVNDALAQRLELTGLRPLQFQAEQAFYKVAVMVPVQDKEPVYEAMAAAGAGKLGNYAKCGFFALGEGRFLPLDGANPAVGGIGKQESVQEIRLEMMVAPANLQAVVSAMKAAHPYEEAAYDVYKTHAVKETQSLGYVGELPQSLTPCELALWVKEKLGARGVRFLEGAMPIKTVAICGGSGGEFLEKAQKLGAEALITADVKHSQMLQAAHLGITLIDAGHFDTEVLVLQPFVEALRSLLPELEIEISAYTPPVYFV